MQKSTDLVSVILTTFNNAPLIEKAIESILIQTHQNLELIIVNDGSTDNTLEIIKKFSDPRIKVLTQENLGAAQAFNNGFKLSQGKWIALMSDDKASHPDRIEVQLNESLKNENDTVIFSHVNFINKDSETIDSPFPKWLFNSEDLPKEKIIHKLFNEGNFLCSSTAFFSRKLVEKNGLMDTKLFQLHHLDLWWKLIKVAEFKIIQRPLLNYAITPAVLKKYDSNRINIGKLEQHIIASSLFTNFSDELLKRSFPIELWHKDFSSPEERKIEEALLLLHAPSLCFQFYGAQKLQDFLQNAQSSDLKKKYNLTRFSIGEIVDNLQSFRDEQAPLALLSRRLRKTDNSREIQELLKTKMLPKLASMTMFKASFLIYAALGFAAKKIHRKLALVFFNKAFKITPDTRFLNYQILLIHKLSNNKPALVDFYIKSLLHKSQFWQKDVDLEGDGMMSVIRQEKGEFFADRLAQQFSIPVKRQNNNNLEMTYPSPYKFTVGLKRIAEYCTEGGAKLIKIAPSRKFSFFLPEVFGDKEKHQASELDVPESWIVEISNAELVGGFCVYKNQNIIIYEEAAYPTMEWLVAGTRNYLYPIKNRPDRANYIFFPKKKIKYSEGILLSGRCSTNYYHWLIEYLPKLFEVSTQPHLANTPLIVDSRMPIQHFQALEILVGRDRKLITYDNEDVLEFEKLIIPSVASYLPDRFDIPMWHSSVISDQHLIYIRDRLLEGVLKTTTPANHYYERIYLSRKRNQGRSITNSQDIEVLFVKKGFHKIYLEELTFQEQVLTIHNAKIIAGPSGAAFSNLLFCKTDTKVIALQSERLKEFSNFSNIGNINHVQFIYLTGPNTKAREKFKSEEEHAHSAYTISIEKISQFFKEFEL